MTSKKRYLEFTGSMPSPALRQSPTRSVTTPLSLFSIHQREKVANLYRQRDFTSPAPSVSASMSAISSETRRMLRELERRNSPVNAGKRMKLSIDTSLSPSYRSHESEMSSPCSSSSVKPPLSSLMTPYRAHILPRLATLNKAPYDRPAKQMVDVGVSADLISIDRPLTAHKSASKLKRVGGSRNKFAAFDLDQDEPEVVNDNEKLSRVPPLSNAPASGFLSSVLTTKDCRQSSSPGSPVPESFAFSSPVVLASPPPSGQHTARANHVNDSATAPFKSVAVQLKSGEYGSGASTVNVPSGSATVQSKIGGRGSGASSATLPFKTGADVAAVSINGPCKSYFSNGGLTVGRDSGQSAASFVPKSTEPLKPVIDPTKWTCSTCYIKNDASVQKCAACQEQRTFDESTKKTTITANAETHWYCTECFIKNAPDQLNCLACGATKPGQTKTSNHAEKSFLSTGYKPDKTTWSCTTCFISNPVERLKCMACCASKPGLDIKPISFGFNKSAGIPKAFESSTVGVQCVSFPDSSPAVPTLSFGFKNDLPSKESESKLSVGSSVAPTSFQFGGTAGQKSEPALQLPSATVTQLNAGMSASVSFPSFGQNKPLGMPKASESSTVGAQSISFLDSSPAVPTLSFGSKNDLTSQKSEPKLPVVSPVAPTSFQLGSAFGQKSEPALHLPSATVTQSNAGISGSSGFLNFGLNKPVELPKTSETSTAGAQRISFTDSSNVVPTFSFGSKNDSASKESEPKLPVVSPVAPTSFQLGPTFGQKSEPAFKLPSANVTQSSVGMSSTGGFCFSSTTSSSSSSTPAASAFNFGVSSATSTSQPVPIQFGTVSSTAAPGQMAAPVLGPFSFVSGTNAFGIGIPSTTPATTATPSTGFSFGLAAPASNTVQPAVTTAQSMFSFPTCSLAFPAPTVPSSISLPTFGQPSQPVNMFSIAPKSGASSTQGRRTLTAKRKGKF